MTKNYYNKMSKKLQNWKKIKVMTMFIFLWVNKNKNKNRTPKKKIKMRMVNIGWPMKLNNQMIILTLVIIGMLNLIKQLMNQTSINY